MNTAVGYTTPPFPPPPRRPVPPSKQPQPDRPSLSRKETVRLIATALPMAFVFDRALFASTIGLGTTLLFIGLGWALAAGTLSRRAPSTFIVPLTVTVLASFLTVRTSPWLLWITTVEPLR